MRHTGASWQGSKNFLRRRDVQQDTSIYPPKSVLVALFPNVRFGRRAQLIDATHSANFSAGVWYCKVLRGLSFN